MKILMTLLATVSKGAPERSRRDAYDEFPLCSTNDGFSVTHVDNSTNGQLTIENTVVDDFWPYYHTICYENFGCKCSDGVEVEIVDMTVPNQGHEVHYYDDHFLGQDEYVYFYDGCFERDDLSVTVHFAWMSNGEQQKTEGQCGCLGGEDHPSCNNPEFAVNPDYTFETELPTKYDLIGTDVRVLMPFGRIVIDWKCIGDATRTTCGSSPVVPTTVITTTDMPTTFVPTTDMLTVVTNTLEMADAVLTGDFKPSNARNYGCSGRGHFNAFEATIGAHVDKTDAAFFVWKKCIQCASGHDESAIAAYSYNVADDTCGKLQAL